MSTKERKLSHHEQSLGIFQLYKKMVNEDNELLALMRSYGAGLDKLCSIKSLAIAKFGSVIVSVEKSHDLNSDVRNFLRVDGIPEGITKYFPLDNDWEPTTHTLVGFSKLIKDVYIVRKRREGNRFAIDAVKTGLRDYLKHNLSKKKALFGIDESHSNVCIDNGLIDIYRFDVRVENHFINNSHWSIRVFERNLNELRGEYNEVKLVEQWDTYSPSTWLDINLQKCIEDVVERSFRVI